MLICPCTYHKARLFSDKHIGYWVTLYLVIEPNGRVTSFLHQSDMVDNVHLSSELGVSLYTTQIEVLCTDTHMSELFKLIQEYENVSTSSY